MRKALTFGILLLVAIAVTTLSAQPAVTVEGTLVDSKYLGMNQDGNDHGTMKACGEMCLKMGQPAGLVTSDGTFHTIVAPVGDLAAHVGHTTRVTGQLHSGAIVATKAEMNANGMYTEIKLSGMM